MKQLNLIYVAIIGCVLAVCVAFADDFDDEVTEIESSVEEPAGTDSVSEPIVEEPLAPTADVTESPQPVEENQQPPLPRVPKRVGPKDIQAPSPKAAENKKEKKKLAKKESKKSKSKDKSKDKKKAKKSKKIKKSEQAG